VLRLRPRSFVRARLTCTATARPSRSISRRSVPSSSPIPDARNIGHLNENLGALDVNLTPAEVRQISTESAAPTVYGERIDAANMAPVE